MTAAQGVAAGDGTWYTWITSHKAIIFSCYSDLEALGPPITSGPSWTDLPLGSPMAQRSECSRTSLPAFWWEARSRLRGNPLRQINQDIICNRIRLIIQHWTYLFIWNTFLLSVCLFIFIFVNTDVWSVFSPSQFCLSFILWKIPITKLLSHLSQQQTQKIRAIPIRDRSSSG